MLNLSVNNSDNREKLFGHMQICPLGDFELVLMLVLICPY